MNKFYAHSKPETADKNTWHSLSNHLSETARRAAGFAEAWGAGDWGYLAGLWHDIGKYSEEFQNRLNALGGENAHIEHASRVDHSTAGAQHAMRAVAEMLRLCLIRHLGHPEGPDLTGDDYYAICGGRISGFTHSCVDFCCQSLSRLLILVLGQVHIYRYVGPLDCGIILPLGPDVPEFHHRI